MGSFIGWTSWELGWRFKCEECGKEFHAKRRHGVKTCSLACRKKLSRRTLKAERS